MHFNHNLHRETVKKKSDGSEQLVVVYPKFKNGEATVRNVKVPANFCMYYTMNTQYGKGLVATSLHCTEP